MDFTALKDGKDIGITRAAGSVLAEAASFCLDCHKHPNPVNLKISGIKNGYEAFHWDDITEQHRKTYADIQEATEWGACGIAISFAKELTGKQYVERSVKGTGFDYWLGDGSEQRGLFQRTARLEISGIFQNDETEIRKRLTAKLKQTNRSRATRLPAFAAVVEFSSPRMVFVHKQAK